MALIICPECGKRFSDLAAACPDCGCPTEIARKSGTGTASDESSAEATRAIETAVAHAKSEAKDAEEEFDRRNDAIQRKASRDIDLLGGRVTRSVVELAADARRACDELYAAYQALIVTLDQTCRPLLAQKPKSDAVKTVAELIAHLNEESEIENNFTASFNQRDLGDVASAKYVPSISNRMIQKYWESKATEMQEERSQKSPDLPIRKNVSALSGTNDKQSNYEMLREEIFHLMKPGIRYTEMDIYEKIQDMDEELTAIKTKALLTQLKVAGRISRETEEGINYYCIQNTLEAEKNNSGSGNGAFIRSELSTSKNGVSNETNMTDDQIRNECLKRKILRCMKPGQLYSTQEIFEAIKHSDPDLSPSKTSALLVMLKRAGYVIREEGDRMMFFRTGQIAEEEMQRIRETAEEDDAALARIVKSKPRAEDEKAKQAEAARLQREKMLKEYPALYKAWKDSCGTIREQRKTEIQARFEQKKQNPEEAALIQAEQEQRAILEQASRKKAEAKEALSKTGAFQFAEKKALKATISEQEDIAIKAGIAAAQIRMKRDDAAKDLERRLRALKIEACREVYAENPLPEEPADPNYRRPTGKMAENERYKEDIMEMLSYNEALSPDEAAYILLVSDTDRILALMTQLKRDGYLERFESNGKVYFRK